MKKVEERREIVLQQIDELEALRPRIEAAGCTLNYYAYSKSVAYFKIYVRAFLVAVAAIFLFALYNINTIGSISMGPPVAALLIIGVSICVIGDNTFKLDTGAKYVIASKGTIKRFDRKLQHYREVVEEFEQIAHTVHPENHR